MLLDTGPLVACLNRRDEYHEWAKSVLAGLAPPMLTCEAVLAESSYLLRNVHDGRRRVLDLIGRGVVTVAFGIEPHVVSLRKLLLKYSDAPMSLADACLVRLSELHDSCTVMTLDRDFRLYRRHGRQTIPVLMPPGL